MIYISLIFPLRLLIVLSLPHSSSIPLINWTPFFSIELWYFSFRVSLWAMFLHSFVKMLRASIVFLTFFYCHESEERRRIRRTDVIKSKWWANVWSSAWFFWDAFTRELKISIANSRWWFDLAFSFDDLSASLSFSLSSSLSMLWVLSVLVLGKRYRSNGFIRLLPREELHSSNILEKNCWFKLWDEAPLPPRNFLRSSL